MTPREAGIQAFYADESTSNTLQGLNAAFDAYEAGLANEWEVEAKALPLGHEHNGRGKSTYNWYRFFIGKLRDRASKWPAHPDQTSPMTVGPEEFFEADHSKAKEG